MFLKMIRNVFSEFRRYKNDDKSRKYEKNIKTNNLINRHRHITMGTNLSKDITPPPLTLQDCLVNGTISLSRYYYYRKHLDTYSEAIERDETLLSNKRKRRKLVEKPKAVRKRQRSVKRHKLMVRDEDGSLREIKPVDTLWYLLYVSNPPTSKRMSKVFRLRFRLPYQSFISLSHDISNHDIFIRWTRVDAVGDPPSNLKLLLLGALRFIGRNWTLDDICEANGISIETNRQFLHAFMEYGSTVLYQKWVLNANINSQIAEQEKVFRRAGFDGCIGSSDATHIPMLRCPHWAHNSHKGFKLSVPARTYNVTCDHSRRILGTTMGHPGTWNDKTLILFDQLIMDVKKGKAYADYEFELYEHKVNGNIETVKYGGVWFMVDNGYLSWSCTVPPDNNGKTYEVIRFSEWLESMRKDVECLFGIMKGRFSILRYGFRFHSITNCDKMWLTCCALHNLLLKEDGLDKNWETGVRSDWEKMNTMRGSVTSQYNLVIPYALTRLHRNFTDGSLEQEDSSDFDENRSSLSERCAKYTRNGKRMVASMPLKLFRECLVQHFDIRFKNNDIVWPTRFNKPTF